MAGLGHTLTRSGAARHTLHFAGGGAAYGALEILWRGYTHASMLFAGGVCLLMLMRLCRSSRSFLAQCLLGAAGITAVEFAVGCVVNLWWGLAVWDYSDMALQLCGQVCALYAVLWVGLCAAVLPLCRLLLRLEARLVHRGRVFTVDFARQRLLSDSGRR